MIIAIIILAFVIGITLGFDLGCKFGSINCIMDWLVDKGLLYRVFIYQENPEIYTYRYRLSLSSATKYALNWWCKKRSLEKRYGNAETACVSITKRHSKLLELEY